MSQDLIYWFEDIGLEERPSVGGKGASLGELTRAKIAIPGGFVVTTKAFRAFMNELDKQQNISTLISQLDPEDHTTVSTATAKIREEIERADIAGFLHDAISEAYEKLGSNIPVAVRSSATSEDSEEASFAGLQDTYLWVQGAEDVVRWVRSCWASLYSPESVIYRLRLKLPEDQLAMGVVVQTMVNSRCSGVMFTRSPTTGDRSVIAIEGSWGLGSSIVSGEVTPDKFVINKITDEINDRAIASKLIEHVPGPKGGVMERDVDEQRQNQPCLSDDELKGLVAIAKKVEKHYGIPQDIEWAIDHEKGEILLLQSRPETVWASKDTAPVASPKAKAFGHIFSLMGGQNKS